MVILYISFPVCLEKQEKRGASVKIRKRGLSFKWAEFSFARGQSWLCHWVNKDVCLGSLEGFMGAGLGAGAGVRGARRERTLKKDWEEFLQLHIGHLYGCTTGCNMWLWISLPRSQGEGNGVCSMRRRIIRQPRFQF